MNNDSTETNSNEFHASMLEALRQNWENARYFESRRWNYIYYYYFALGAAIIYFGNIFKECGFDFLQGDPQKFVFISVIFFFLTLIGLGAFLQLAHTNLEYKNFIRSNEFIAEYLKLNQGFREFRLSNGNNEDKRKAYMGLPLRLHIRKIVSAINLTAFGAAFSAGVTVFYGLWFMSLIRPNFISCEVILIIAAATLVIIFLLLVCYFKKKEDEAENKLSLRDPTDRLGKDAQKNQ